MILITIYDNPNVHISKWQQKLYHSFHSYTPIYLAVLMIALQASCKIDIKNFQHFTISVRLLLFCNLINYCNRYVFNKLKPYMHLTSKYMYYKSKSNVQQKLTSKFISLYFIYLIIRQNSMGILLNNVKTPILPSFF